MLGGRNMRKIDIVNSTVTTGTCVCEELQKITRDFEGLKTVCWLNHEIKFGIFSEDFLKQIGGFESLCKHILRFRIFDQDRELFLWKTGDIIKYRLRNDQSGESVEVIDADQVMWGTTFIGSDGMIKVSESRGVKYELPESCVDNPLLPGAERLVLRTRNYVDYNEIGQASFVDSRFVSIRFEEVRI
jgi:CRISPR-associated protein (TIGR03984 family)